MGISQLNNVFRSDEWIESIYCPFQCILTVEISPPIPVIEGGFERYIGEGLDILLNASRSKDFNSLDISDPNNFEYSWIYDCETCGGFITAPQKSKKRSFNFISIEN